MENPPIKFQFVLGPLAINDAPCERTQIAHDVLLEMAAKFGREQQLLDSNQLVEICEPIGDSDLSLFTLLFKPKRLAEERT